MSDQRAPVCVLALTMKQAAELNAVLSAVNRMGKDVGLSVAESLEEVRPYIGPNGQYMPDEPALCKESAQAVRMLKVLGEYNEGQRDAPKNTTADPVDVVQEALNKAGGGKVIPVDFNPKGKED